MIWVSVGKEERSVASNRAGKFLANDGGEEKTVVVNITMKRKNEKTLKLC